MSVILFTLNPVVELRGIDGIVRYLITGKDLQIFSFKKDHDNLQSLKEEEEDANVDDEEDDDKYAEVRADLSGHSQAP